MINRGTAPIESVVEMNSIAIARLIAAGIWQAIFMAHLVAILLLFWWYQVYPETILEAVLQRPEPLPLRIFFLLGISVPSALYGYWKALRWLHQKRAMPWALDWLMRKPAGSLSRAAK